MLKETIAFVILSIYVSTCSAVCLNKAVIRGGLTDADINDPGVIAAASFANNVRWEDISDIKNSQYVIQSAKSQIVTGIKYYLKIEYPAQKLFCDFEVTYQSWVNEYSLLSDFCIFEDGLPTRIASIPPTALAV
jgi:hypothetical protein